MHPWLQEGAFVFITGRRQTEYLAALLALVTLAGSALAELSAFRTAVVAGHKYLDLSSGQRHNGVGHTPYGFGLRLAPLTVCTCQRGVVSKGDPGWIRTSIPPFAKQGSVRLSYGAANTHFFPWAGLASQADKSRGWIKHS